jgi:sugar phosphate isomerase/epimerase
MSFNLHAPVAQQGATPLWTCSLLSTLAPHASAALLGELAVSSGAAALELRCGAKHAHGVELGVGAGQCRQARDAWEAYGVMVADLASPARIGSSSIDLFAAYLQLADDVAAAGVRVFCDDRLETESRDEWVARIVRGGEALYQRFGERAEHFWIENHGTTADSETLLAVAHAHFGFVWDVGHSSAHREEPRAVWARIGHRVRHVHVKDWRRLPDDTWDRKCALLEGDLLIEAALSVLADAGYRGCVSVEVPPPAGLPDLQRLAEWRARHEKRVGSVATAC